jgi:hypothetical protein
MTELTKYRPNCSPIQTDTELYFYDPAKDKNLGEVQAGKTNPTRAPPSVKQITSRFVETQEKNLSKS